MPISVGRNKISGTMNLSTADAKLTGEAASDTSGISVDSAGDFNNDGFDRWSRIYSEDGEVNSVQLDIRNGVVTHTLVAKKVSRPCASTHCAGPSPIPLPMQVKQNLATREETAVPKNNHIGKSSYEMDDDMDD